MLARYALAATESHALTPRRREGRAEPTCARGGRQVRARSVRRAERSAAADSTRLESNRIDSAVRVEWWATLCCGIEGKLHLESILSDTRGLAAGGSGRCVPLFGDCESLRRERHRRRHAAERRAPPVITGLSIAVNRLN